MGTSKGWLCKWEAELESGTKVPVTARSVKDAQCQLKACGEASSKDPVIKLHFLENVVDGVSDMKI